MKQKGPVHQGGPRAVHQGRPFQATLPHWPKTAPTHSWLTIQHVATLRKKKHTSRSLMDPASTKKSNRSIDRFVHYAYEPSLPYSIRPLRVAVPHSRRRRQRQRAGRRTPQATQPGPHTVTTRRTRATLHAGQSIRRSVISQPFQS